MDPWHFIKDGQYAAAVKEYGDQLRDRPSASGFYNRAIAYLNLHEFAKAQEDFTRAEELHRATTAGDAYRSLTVASQDVGPIQSD